MFSLSPADGVLRQGEIVSDVIQVHLRTNSLAPDATDVDVEEKVHPYALILTQDCDLDWDFKARAAGPEDQRQDHEQMAREENKRQAKLVPNTLLCELTTTELLRPRLAGGDVLLGIRANLDERYHCLSELLTHLDRAGEGLPELVADFKRVFSVPTDEFYLRVALGMRRRALLQSPYLQHLSSRFGYYCLRVALPEDLPAEIAAPAPVIPQRPPDGDPN